MSSTSHNQNGIQGIKHSSEPTPNDVCRYGNVNGETVLLSCSNNGTVFASSENEYTNWNDTYEHNFEQWEIVRFLNVYYIPILIIVGIVGNVLSCIVFLNTRLRMRSSSYYLAALAITDVTYILIIFLVWLELLGLNTFNVNVFCQLEIYVGSVSSSLSVWLTVAFTVERFIAVQYPLQRPNVCTIHRAKTIIGSLSGFSILAHFYIFIAAGVNVVQTEAGDVFMECNLKEEYLGMMNVINCIDTVFTLVLPFVLIVVMNTLIARQLIKFSRRFRQRDDIRCLQEVERAGQLSTVKKVSGASSSQQSGQMCYCSSHNHHRVPHHALQQPPPSSSSSTAKINNNVVVKPSFATAAIAFTRKSQENQKSILSTRTQYSITKMLLLTSTVFILLNLPSYVIRVHAFVTSLWGTHGSAESESKMMNLQQLFMFLQHTHYSINFVFYSTCGTTFRKCLFQLLPVRLRSCCKPSANFQSRYQ